MKLQEYPNHKLFNGLRILHFLSPVRWKGDTFLNETCSNWSAAKKTIEALPNCHHYILCPPKHSIPKSDNITFIDYNYPKSVLLNRMVFDHRGLDFNFEEVDVDFVFNHQPEHHFSLKSWFDSRRYNHSVGFFSFFHWIDCDKGRSSASPPSFFRQLDSFIFADCNFIHTDACLDYFKENFSYEIPFEKERISYMPVNPIPNVETEPFELPDKKIIVFNNRWNKTMGIDRLKSYLSKIDTSDYIIWFTDEKCDLEGYNIIKKSLTFKQYNYLLSKCYCCICFMDRYAVWSLAAQDSFKFNRPTLCYEHPVIRSILGSDYPYFFDSYKDFEVKLKNVKEINHKIPDFHSIFINNLYTNMEKFLNKYNERQSKYGDLFINEIKNGLQFKKEILNKIRPNIKFSGADAPLRRVIMNNTDIIDDITSKIPKYSIKNNTIIIDSKIPDYESHGCQIDLFKS